MKLVPAFPVTPANLESCTIPELSPGEAAYAAGTTYAQGVGGVAYGTRLYESLQGNNTGHQPDTSPTWWLDTGPTNRWAMFDAINGTVSQAQDSINFVVQTKGRVNSVNLLNVIGNNINIKARSGGNEVYNETFSLTDYTPIVDWYTYLFAELDQLNDLVTLDLPMYSGMEIEVTLNGSGPVSVGNVVMGQARDLGDTTYGAKLGINDYSKKATDDFGNYTVVERAFSRRGTFTVIVKDSTTSQAAAKVATLQKLLAGLRATPVLWVGSEAYTASFIFGFYRSFELEVAYPLQSVMSLEIEGLT